MERKKELEDEGIEERNEEEFEKEKLKEKKS